MFDPVGQRVLGDKLYFTAYDPRFGWELWVVDRGPRPVRRRLRPDG